MWYEILPAFGVILGAMAFGFKGSELPPWLMSGRHHFRDIRENDQQHMYMRDRGITGCAYKMQGLEAIPDEDAKEIKGEPRVKNWRWYW